MDRGSRSSAARRVVADLDHPLIWIQSEHWTETSSLLVGFGIDTTFDVASRDAVEQALQAWLPDVEVLDVSSHDWVTDEFSAGTWPMLRPHQLTRYHADVREPNGNVYLAGSDWADGWAGFIDGAIESAMRTSARVAHNISQRKGAAYVK